MTRWLPLLALAAALPALAQQPPPGKQPSPEEMKKMMDASMSAMVQPMLNIADGMIEVSLRRAEDVATARRIARFKKHLLDALVSEGFSKDEALEIVRSTPVPMATAGR